MVQFHAKQNSNRFSSQAIWAQKYIEWVHKFQPNIREIFEDKFVLYMNNDVKNVSAETLKWYYSYEIETGPSNSSDINPI